MSNVADVRTEGANEPERKPLTVQSVLVSTGRPIDLIISLLAIASATFALYTGLFGEEVELIQRGVHLAFSVAVIFILSSKDDPFWRRAPLMLAALIMLYSGAYIVIEYDNIMAREGELTTHEIVLGVLVLPLLLEATRRSIGWALPLVSVVCVVYAYFGPYLPLGLGHRGYDIERLASHLFLSTDGIYGTPLGVSATFIFMFVLFGSFLQTSRAGEFLTNLALATTGRSRGGPAKVAVVSSAFFGTMSGSAIANASATGTFTIPLMRRVGYRPHIAAAFESLASLGGQLMPPIMGSAAFVMVEFTQISYMDIAAAAFFPGLLFFFSVFMIVDFEAARNGLKGLPSSELPNTMKTLNEGWLLFVPLAILFGLLYLGFSTFMAAFWSIPSIILVAATKRKTRLSFPQILKALRKGGIAVTGIAAACACSGIIVGVATVTGLAVEISNIMINMAGGNLFSLLLITMVVSIILGMGLPTVACYILLAVLVGPALEQMGLSTIGAHLFIFYFGIVSGITPPVALVSYAAAGVANIDAMKTSWAACRLGISIYILPFAFIYVPELLLIGDLQDIALRIVLTFGAFYMIAAVVQGYLFTVLRIGQRIILAVFAFGVLFPEPVFYLTVGVLSAVYLWYLRNAAKTKADENFKDEHHGEFMPGSAEE